MGTFTCKSHDRKDKKIGSVLELDKQLLTLFQNNCHLYAFSLS